FNGLSTTKQTVHGDQLRLNDSAIVQAVQAGEYDFVSGLQSIFHQVEIIHVITHLDGGADHFIAVGYSKDEDLILQFNRSFLWYHQCRFDYPRYPDPACISRAQQS